MILVDTSIWIDHLQSHDEQLAGFLDHANVVVHPFIIGELACGNLRNRREILRLLEDLPHALVASQREVLHLIERQRLMGEGIGFIDAHLLASAALTDQTVIWTRDKRLRRVSQRLGLSLD